MAHKRRGNNHSSRRHIRALGQHKPGPLPRPQSLSARSQTKRKTGKCRVKPQTLGIAFLGSFVAPCPLPKPLKSFWLIRFRADVYLLNPAAPQELRGVGLSPAV